MQQQQIQALLKHPIYFVSGIDTDAGKSFATGYLLREFIAHGITSTSQKFIQTGGVSPVGLSIDIEVHRAIAGVAPTEADRQGVTCPVVFSYSASPHLAAKLEGKSIDFEKIRQSTTILHQQVDILLIEGAGGLHVPLTDDMTTIDYIRQGNWPLLLVSSGKLGSINHTLLSLEACAARGIEVAGVLYNNFFEGEDKIINDDTKQYIRQYLQHNLPHSLFIEVPVIELPSER